MKFVNKKERESAKIRAYFEARLTLLPNTPKYEEFIITCMLGVYVFEAPLETFETAKKGPKKPYFGLVKHMLLAARSPISRPSRYFDEALEVRSRAKSTQKRVSKHSDFLYFEIFICKGFR